MKRKLDQLQESEGYILSDHQMFVSLFERHLLPSSSRAVPHIEAPNDRLPVPLLSGVLPSTEAPNDQSPVPSFFRVLPSPEAPNDHLPVPHISGALLSTEVSQKQPL
ncbi:hypothetical protein FF1_034481 [Malus domestica]